MTPADIANRSLDAIGHPYEVRIGDLQEGGIAAVLLRHYGAALRQLLRSAHWNFARTRAELTLLQDATSQTTQAQINAGHPVTVGIGTPGMRPWVYEYAWPINAVKARFVPMTMGQVGPAPPPGNISLPPGPQMGGGSGVTPFIRDRPARFSVGQDAVPNLIGVPATWDEFPDLSTTMGQAIPYQTVILTNVRCAALVYTALLTDPNQWDPLFQQAFVALLASLVAVPLIPDRKLGIGVRAEQIKIAKAALDQARVTDGDEGWFTVDHIPDWLRIRNSGPWRGGAGLEDGPGMLWGGWDACSFCDGSAY